MSEPHKIVYGLEATQAIYALADAARQRERETQLDELLVILERGGPLRQRLLDLLK